MTYQIVFRSATVTNCDYIGRTVSGIVAVVIEHGREIFTSKPHTKRITCKMECAEFLKTKQGG
jgi:hypothetical protein